MEAAGDLGCDALGVPACEGLCADCEELLEESGELPPASSLACGHSMGGKKCWSFLGCDVSCFLRAMSQCAGANQWVRKGV